MIALECGKNNPYLAEKSVHNLMSIILGKNAHLLSALQFAVQDTVSVQQVCSIFFKIFANKSVFIIIL